MSKRRPKTIVVSMQIEVPNRKGAANRLHENLCRAIHELDTAALRRLQRAVIDIAAK